MKQIVKIALVLVVLQVVLTNASPTSPKEVDPSPKQVLIDFLGEKYQSFKIVQRSEYRIKQISLLKEAIAKVEAKKESGDESITAESIEELKKMMDDFVKTFEQWEADKTSCPLHYEMENKIGPLQDTIVLMLNEEDDDKYVNLNQDSYRKAFVEIKAEALPVLKNYVKALPETEQKDFQEASPTDVDDLCMDLYAHIENQKLTYEDSCLNTYPAARHFLHEMATSHY